MAKTKTPAKAGPVAVRILRDHDHKLAPSRVLAFKAGTTDEVDPAVAEALYAAEAAEPLTAQTED